LKNLYKYQYLFFLLQATLLDNKASIYKKKPLKAVILKNVAFSKPSWFHLL
jgi:hypothetical protein